MISLVQVKTGDLLVQDLGESVHADLELASSLLELRVFLGESLILGIEEEDLSQSLIGERARHDERRVTSGASQVNKTTLGQEDDTAAVLHVVTVNLGLNRDDLLGVSFEPGNVNFAVEVTNIFGVVRTYALQILGLDTYCRQWSHLS